jgi:hypothetical protein
MSTGSILTGARAQLMINGKIIGLFTSCSYSLNYDVNPAFILGRYSAAELTYTGQDVVSVDANGFRVIAESGNNTGPHTIASVPKLQELMTAGEITLALSDRKTGKVFMQVTGVKPVGYSSSVSARGVVELGCRFMGRLIDTEEGSNNESGSASSLLSGT